MFDILVIVSLGNFKITSPKHNNKLVKSFPNESPSHPPQSPRGLISQDPGTETVGFTRLTLSTQKAALSTPYTISGQYYFVAET